MLQVQQMPTLRRLATAGRCSSEDLRRVRSSSSRVV
jgi:hypothetical protein